MTLEYRPFKIKPNPMGHGALDGVPAETSCSESGITLRYGKQKGRLLMPARVQPPTAMPQPPFRLFQRAVAYSDSTNSTRSSISWSVGLLPGSRLKPCRPSTNSSLTVV